MASSQKIKIDKALYRKLVEAAEREGYASTGELIHHVLERAAAGVEEDQDRARAEQQLRGLGYIE